MKLVHIISGTLMALAIAAHSDGQVTTGYHRVGQVLARGSSGVEAVIQPYSTIAVTSTATDMAATIYSDPLLTAPIIPSVVTADEGGNYDYYLPLGYCVTETISYPSAGGIVIQNICVISSTTTGLINSGTTGQLAYYASNGTTISGENFATIVQGGTGAMTAGGAWTNILAGSSAAANTVLAGPASGGSAPLAIRGLVSADIPDNAANTSGNAATSNLADTATALATAPAQCPGGQFATGIAVSGDANCGSASAGITQINGGGDATTPSGGGVQPLTLNTVNGSPGSCGDATHVCQVTTDGKGRTTAQTAVAITYPVGPTTTIIGKVTFTSCTVVDDGNAGEGCEATQSWGATLPATYYMWCQVGTWSGGGTIGNRGGFAINIATQTTTDFSYNIDSRQDSGRTIAALATTCWASN